MYQFIVQIARPFASALYYRSYIKGKVAEDYRQKHPTLTVEEAETLAELDIWNNKVPALDVTKPWKSIAKNPRKAGKGFLKLVITVAVLWVLMWIVIALVCLH